MEDTKSSNTNVRMVKSITVSPQIWKEAKAAAARNGIFLSEYIEEAILVRIQIEKDANKEP